MCATGAKVILGGANVMSLANGGGSCGQYVIAARRRIRRSLWRKVTAQGCKPKTVKVIKALFYSPVQIYAAMCIRWVWARQDSNLRRHKPTDLQSVPFGRSGTRPFGPHTIYDNGAFSQTFQNDSRWAAAE